GRWARGGRSSSTGVRGRSASRPGSRSTSSSAQAAGSGVRKRAPARPPYSTLAPSVGSMMRPRLRNGMSNAVISLSAHVVHELVVGRGRARAGDLVVAALELAEPHHAALDARAAPAARTVVVPVHDDLV